jgi:hypothetical protein
MDPQLKRRRTLWAGALAITTLAAQYSTVIMAQHIKSVAYWNDQEVTALVDYLVEYRAEAGDGGNFKSATFNAAANHIAHLLSQGPVKTGKMCKTKWNSVCIFQSIFALSFTKAIQLRQTYTAIETYRNQSGFHWDDDKGASIAGDAAADVWNTYIQQKV